MSAAFDEDYYDGDADDEKPTWDDDIDIDAIIQEQEEQDAAGEGKSSKKTKKEKRKKNDGIVMDADFLEDGPEHEETGGKKLSKAEKKKLKKREKAKARKAEERGDADGVDLEEMDAAQKDEELDDVQAMSHSDRKRRMGEMMDQYYGLEYEDMVSLERRFDLVADIRSLDWRSTHAFQVYGSTEILVWTDACGNIDGG